MEVSYAASDPKRAAQVANAVSDAYIADQLQARHIAVAQQESTWSSRYGADHAAAVNLRKEMSGLQASITSEVHRMA